MFKKRKNFEKAIHKAACIKDREVDLEYFTVCKKTSCRTLRTTEWDKVTCPLCLQQREN
jgi:hypothetical protein